MQDDDESYLNISFQEIVNLLVNNESASLSSAIHQSVFNSRLIVLGLLIYGMTINTVDTLTLFDSLVGPTVQVLSGYYFLKWFSTALALYSLFRMNYVIGECQMTGELSPYVVEFLKYTIRGNSPFDSEDYYDDELELTQAQWVAKAISYKIHTHNWLNFLLNYESLHMSSVNKVILLLESLLFLWGNTLLVQQSLSSFDSLFIVYSLLLWYFLVLVLMLSVILLLLGAIPLMLTLIIWQTCTCLTQWVNGLYEQFILRENQRNRTLFLSRLIPRYYGMQKDDSEVCVICLGSYGVDDLVTHLPCNVGEGEINHFFHSSCISVWIE